MRYVKRYISTTEFNGESFYINIDKISGEVWAANEGATAKMYDGSGTEISSVTLTKTGDDLKLYGTIPKADTVGITGKYTILVNQTDSTDATFSDVSVVYNITYEDRKA